MCYGRWDSSLGAFNVISAYPKPKTSLPLQSGMVACLETMPDNLLDIMEASSDDILGDVKKNSSAAIWAARLGRYIDNIRFWGHPDQMVVCLDSVP